MAKVKKTIYETPCEATYLYETTNYDGTFNYWTTKVSVLGETAKSYFIKLCEPVPRHMAGDIICVMKKKVRFSKKTAYFSKKTVDLTQYWFNNFESRELSS